MKKHLKVKVVVSLSAVLFFFACSDNLTIEDLNNLNLNQEFSVTFDEEALVSVELATSVAKAFLSDEIAKKSNAKSLSIASIETVKDKSNNPLMYVVNYSEGGWVIVGASRNYYPVLAFSDEGSFEIKPETEMGSVVVWLDETKEAVRVSAALDETTKDQMRTAWQVYETSDKKIASGAKNYQMMYDRMAVLSSLYGSSGWNPYYSLEDVEGKLKDPNAYQALLDLADRFFSPPEYTIVAIKNTNSVTLQAGPMVLTEWHQDAPFNDKCAIIFGNIKYPAGCVPIAMAQIMRFHLHPAIVYYPANHHFNWYNMPFNEADYTNPISTYSTPALIGNIRSALGMGSGVTNSTITAAKDAFLSTYNYQSATIVSHNDATVRTEIINQRPVFMSGVANSGVGHAWVCSGVMDQKTKIYYFVEFFTGSGYNNYNYWTPSNPGTSVYSTTSNYYHMNWGGGNQLGAPQDSWYFTNTFPSGYSYSNNRQNLYIVKP